MGSRRQPFWMCVILLIGLLFSPVAVTAHPTSPEVGREDWTAMVFISTRDGNPEIYRARGDGSQPVRLTFTPGAEANPRLNRGGTQILYEAKSGLKTTDIYKMNVDGTNITQLTSDKSNDYDADWSPDSSQIVFVSERKTSDAPTDIDPEIYVMNVDGSRVTRLTNNKTVDRNPSWSAARNQILWIAYNQMNYGNLVLMNPDGSGVDPVFYEPGLPLLARARLSPNGKQIAYHTISTTDHTSLTIYIVEADMHTPMDAVQPLSEITLPYPFDVTLGDWSPDSQHVLFTTHHADGKTYLEYMTVDRQWSGEIVRLPGSNNDRDASWNTLDTLPPDTHLLPLPPYSRVSGFNIQAVGGDQGVSGIKHFFHSFRYDDQPWMLVWDAFRESWQAFWSGGTPGTTIYFRTAAIDNAGNREPYPASSDGETHTTLYTWELGGQVTDARGEKLYDQPVTLSPAAINMPDTGSTGSYQAYIQDSNAYELTTQRAGYGTLPALNVNMNSDRLVDLYLPATENLIQNSNFETSLAGWLAGGTLPVSRTVDVLLGDSHVLHIGPECGLLCLEPVTDFGPTADKNGYDLAVDSLGNAHILTMGSGLTTDLMYYRRAQDGTWSTPELVHRSPYYNDYRRTHLDVDGQGGLHATWIASAVGDLFYSYQPPGGVWSPPKNFGACRDQNLAADAYGNVHMICRLVYPYPEHSYARYYYRKAGETWQAPLRLGISSAYESAIAVGPDQAVHFLVMEGTQVVYQSRLANGAFTERMVISTSSMVCAKPQLVIDTDNTLHAVWEENYNTVYAARPADQPWPTPTRMIHYKADTVLSLDPFGSPRITRIYWDNAYRFVFYLYKDPRQGWSTEIPSPDVMANFYATTPDGTQHFLADDYNQLHYSAIPANAVASFGSASQRVTLPAGMNHPTLAFQYQLFTPMPSAASRLAVSITDAITTTQVYTGSPSTGWSHGWADLSAWAGQTVSVTFTLDQAAGEPVANLYLDRVSLGSWLTPLIRSARANQSRTTVNLTGENFLPGCQVYIGGTAAPNVSHIDEHTLQLTFPTALAPGRYEVKVVNPGGQYGLVPDLLQVGTLIYLPAVLR